MLAFPQQDEENFFSGAVDQINEAEVRLFFRDHAEGSVPSVPLPALTNPQGGDWATRLQIHQLACVALAFFLVCISWDVGNVDRSETPAAGEFEDGYETNIDSNSETAKKDVCGRSPDTADSSMKADAATSLPLMQYKYALVCTLVGMAYLGWEYGHPGASVLSTPQLKVVNTGLFVGICARIKKGGVAWPQLLRRFSSKIVVCLPAVSLILTSGGCCSAENGG